MEPVGTGQIFSAIENNAWAELPIQGPRPFRVTDARQASGSGTDVLFLRGLFAYSTTRTYRKYQYIYPGKMVITYAKSKPEADVTAGITR